MVLGICPRCHQRYSYNKYDVDYVHQCNSNNTVLDEEDVIVVGNYEDEVTGSTVVVPKMQVAFQGSENKLFGTRAGIEGEDVTEFTERGERADTKRQRQFYKYIKVK